ncbi:MAG: hypothetical protein JXQ71_15110 [Verrucomicrobia bacterium]|nr:hypothetical protein [Verrucomicrobiota bacterium]
MNTFHLILIFLAAFLAVFFQAVVDTPRAFVGAQVDLLPSLMVYVSLSCGLTVVAAAAAAGGLLHDSLSANSLGTSILPLFLVGFVIQRYRGLILRDQTYAQFILGLAASAAAPVLAWIILVNVDTNPLVGWQSAWQWFVMTLLGGVAAPLWFRLFGWALGALTYPPLSETGFRHEREIKRGRKPIR